MGLSAGAAAPDDEADELPSGEAAGQVAAAGPRAHEVRVLWSGGEAGDQRRLARTGQER